MTSQEFWATATRAPAQNGLGLAVAAAAAVVNHIEPVSVLLIDYPTLYDHWKRLVMTYGVVGNRVYDARLVAAMTVQVLTFNVTDFSPYPIEVVDAAVVSQPADLLGYAPGLI